MLRLVPVKVILRLALPSFPILLRLVLLKHLNLPSVPTSPTSSSNFYILPPTSIHSYSGSFGVSPSTIRQCIVFARGWLFPPRRVNERQTVAFARRSSKSYG